MEYGTLGKTGFPVSRVGFGAWAIGADWGDVTETDAMAALNAALDEGITFFDTADVYGDGRSERLIARLRQKRPSVPFTVATKAGRRLNPHVASGYSAENIEGFVDRSLTNLQVDSLELVQLHCPPTDVYYNPDLFTGLDDMVRRGKIKHYGVSVERVEEAMKAIEYPGVETVQIVFNMLRLRPSELFFGEARRRDVGVIVRVPLASGLLTGKMRSDTTFADDDHRKYNRKGEAFDVGETFAGIDYETGLSAVEEIRALVPEGATMAQLALRWILMFDAVSTVIPGGKTPTQVIDNARSADLPELSPKTMAAVVDIYDRHARPGVHHRCQGTRQSRVPWQFAPRTATQFLHQSPLRGESTAGAAGGRGNLVLLNSPPLVGGRI